MPRRPRDANIPARAASVEKRKAAELVDRSISISYGKDFESL